MNPFEHLGIEPGADEREIKRAYARKLKITRPDEDPVAFQALHDAYSQCLSIAHSAAHHRGHGPQTPRDRGSPNESAQSPPVGPSPQPPTPSPHADETQHEPAASQPAPVRSRHPGANRPQAVDRTAPTRIQFDLDGFLRELFARAATDRPIDLLRWLRGLESLYALDLKHALRLPIAHALAQADPPLPGDAIDAIAEFFALVTTDPLEQRLRQAWELAHHRSERNAQFKRIVAQRRSPHARPVERWLMHELLGPRSWWRRLFIALAPMLPTRLMELLDRLEQTDASLAESQLDAASVGFWRRATDRLGLNYRRLLIALARCAFYYLLAVGLAALLMGLDPAPFAHAGRNVAGLFAAWLIAAALWAGLMRAKALLEHRWGWDLAIVLATPALLACLVAGYFKPVEAAFFACLITVVLMLLRGRVHSVPAVSFYIASLTALCAIVPLLGRPLDPLLACVAVAAGALQIAHDVAYARAHKISVARTRDRSGWLWYLAGGFGVAAVALLFAGVSG